MHKEDENVKHKIWKHIIRVRELLGEFNAALVARGMAHDRSKMNSPEIEIFKKFTPRLKELTYGSKEYTQCLREMKPALDHHYRYNRHHPEHHQNGVDGMTLVDLIEMFADWKAASERCGNGDFMKSIDINTDRFNMSPQLARILKNTAVWCEEQERAWTRTR